MFQQRAAGLILKTRTAAIHDGDNILAVVSQIYRRQHHGRSQGLAVPNIKVQITMQMTLEKPNLTPAEIECVVFTPENAEFLFTCF